MRIQKNEIGICVGCLTTNADREIGGIQKWCIDQMIGGIVIEVLTGMVLRGIGGTKDSRAGNGLIEIIEGLIAIMGGISLEIGVRVKILVEGTEDMGGRLHFLKVRVDQNDQSQSVKNIPIRLSAIYMLPVELPYVPILLNETLTKALWDTGAVKSFISEEVYKKYFFINQ
ncbi:uncharacterized protein TNCV_3067351 [Trichonephila clavipes]|nr:uncharacterized protein TNCV_3067351 [Trichonephila clavipes]